MRVLLLANPKAGSSTPPEALAEALARHGGDVLETRTLEDAERPPEATERIVVAGGDGSLGTAAALAAEHGVPLAVIPTGTANDFARAMGLPDDPEAACRLAAAGTRTRRIDLATSGDRAWLNAASAGLAVQAARAASPLKRVLGPVAYAAGAAWAALRAHPLRCRVECDGEERFAGGAWQVIVSNSGAFGGGAQIGRARLDDGLLDVTVIPARSRLRLARYAFGLRTGRITEQPGVTFAQGTAIAIEPAPAAGMNVDGELVPVEPARFGVRRAALEVVVG